MKSSAKVFVVSVIGLSAVSAQASGTHPMLQYPNGAVIDTVDHATYRPDGTLGHGEEAQEGEPKLINAATVFYSDGEEGLTYGSVVYYSNGDSGFYYSY